MNFSAMLLSRVNNSRELLLLLTLAIIFDKKIIMTMLFLTNHVGLSVGD